MPICIPDDLPAVQTLKQENIFVMGAKRATTQDIRPLRIGVLNLMPTKVATETQLARLLGNTPLQVQLELIKLDSHVSKNTSPEHMVAFYRSFTEIKAEKFDGFIITGAPVEQMPFEAVDYWQELCEVMEWTKTHVYSTLHICWGAQAALYYHYGVQKHPLKEKMFGVFPHRIVYPNPILMRGFDDIFYVPHSRHTTVLEKEVREKAPNVKILATSQTAGLYAAFTEGGRQVFLTGHSEYDADTLKKEYLRDRNAGLPIAVPVHYFEDDDPQKEPIVRWRSCANLLFSNWLNYFVYQDTPYDLENIQ